MYIILTPIKCKYKQTKKRQKCYQFIHSCQYVQRSYHMVHIPHIANVSTRFNSPHVTVAAVVAAACVTSHCYVYESPPFLAAWHLSRSLVNDCIASAQSPFFFLFVFSLLIENKSHVIDNTNRNRSARHSFRAVICQSVNTAIVWDVKRCKNGCS